MDNHQIGVFLKSYFCMEYILFRYLNYVCLELIQEKKQKIQISAIKKRRVKHRLTRLDKTNSTTGDFKQGNINEVFATDKSFNETLLRGIAYI